MKKIKRFWTILLGLSFLQIMCVSPSWALFVQDEEMNGIYKDIYNIFIGYDLSTQLPAIGTFDNGLGDASKAWTVDSSGGGTVVQYTNATEGWLGLRCDAGQSVAVEYGPIYVTLTPDSASKPSFGWDQIAAALHFRGSPTFQSKIAGKVQFEFYDAVGRERHPLAAIDASSSAFNGYCPAVGLDSTGKANRFAWAAYAWQFTVPHSSWYKISKVRISYSVPSPSGFYIPTTEVQLDQVYVAPFWTKPY
jgi:hypothetical protein